VNMGCPKEFSIKGGCGAALLKQPEKVQAILTALVAEAKIPVTCKIRVLSTVEATIELAKLIQSCGVSAIGIHGRTKDERQGHKNRNHFIKEVAEQLNIPVIAK
jgi:tRNA-dihydrouridine synthase 2